MKNFTFTFLFLFPFIGFGQKVPEGFDIEFRKLICECLEDENNFDYDLFLSCSIENFKIAEKDFEEYFTISGFQSSKEFGEFMMLNSQEDLINNCPYYVSFMDYTRLDGFEKIKKMFYENPNISLESMNLKIAENNSLEMYNLRGLYYFAHKDYENAKKDFQEAIKINPEFLESKFFLGLSYEYSNELDAAFELYKVLVNKSTKPEFSTALLIIQKKLIKN